MIRLKCVNINPITIETPSELLLMTANDLELGKTYTTQNNHPYQSEDCILVYDINGIGERLAERFEVI